MNICFRVDASGTIGSGHFMRCMTLAAALRERGAACHFITREHEGHLAALAVGAGFAVTELPLMDIPEEAGHRAYGAWVGASWEVDARQTLEAIGSAGVDWLVVDHYGLDSRWEKAVRGVSRRLLVIDDLADRPHACDLLLDQNFVASMERRYDGLVPRDCGLMLGPSFALLQPAYADLRERVPPREGPVERILVYFGGSDRHDLSGRAVRSLLELGRPDLGIDLVVNPDSPFAPALRELTDSWPQVTLHERQETLAALMARADLALGAAGSTSWERCCLGLPTLLVTLAQNQRPIAAELDKRGLARWIGDVETVTGQDIGAAVRVVLEEGSIEGWSRLAAGTDDGRGAHRVCTFLMLDRDMVLTPRFAEVGDEELVLEWANDPQARRHAFSPEPISAQTHHRWFRARLRDLDNCVFLILCAPGGVPVGQVRFDRRGPEWEISYMLDPRCRGRGLGAPLLGSAIARLAELVPGAACFGRARASNAVSLRVFESLGFACEVDGDVFTYRLQLTG